MGLTKRFLFNDASWDGTCRSQEEFRMCMRFIFECVGILRSQGVGLEVCHGFFSRPLAFAPTVREAVAMLEPDQKRRVHVWVDREGPFWDRPAAHSSSEYFECMGSVVTETALAEAAQLKHWNEEAILVSLPGGNYTAPDLEVVWHESPFGTLASTVTNAASIERVEKLVSECLTPFDTPTQFVEWAADAFSNLLINKAEMIAQMGYSVSPAALNRGRELLNILDSIAAALNAGNQTRYDELCQTWLRSQRFSDSSDSEKNDRNFKRRMTFRHPETGADLICYWHGKVRTGVFRMHFEWPPPLQSRRLYVAYFGPKLTKT